MENKRRKIEETLQDSVIWDNSLIKEIKVEDSCYPEYRKRLSASVLSESHILRPRTCLTSNS